MMQLAIIIVLLWNNCVEGQSVNHDFQPMNTVALLKSKVVLGCYQDHDREVVWNFYDVRKTGEVGGTLLSNRGKILPEFNGTFLLNRSLPGQYDLVIRSVNLENAGIYECTKRAINQPSAHLTVLQDHACGVRNANGGIVSAHNGDTIQLSCTIHLTGHCQPAVDWTFDNGTFIGRSVSNDTNFESRISISTFDFTVKSNEGSVGFIATISFYCPGKDLHFNKLSSTFPEYKHVWKSPNIKILDSLASEKYSLTTAIPKSTNSDSLASEKYSLTTAIPTSTNSVPRTTTVTVMVYVATVAVIVGVIVLLLSKIHGGICCWGQCKGQTLEGDFPKGSIASSVKHIDSKERSSLSTRASDNHSIGYSNSPRKCSLSTPMQPESIENEIIATYAETRIFASNIFMSCGASSHGNSTVGDNASAYSKVIKPKPTKTSDLDSISTKSSRSKRTPLNEDVHLQRNEDILAKHRHVGADGTTYSELKGSGSQHIIRDLPSSQHVRRNKPIYADMDHTLNDIRTRPPLPIPTLPPLK